MADDQTAVAEPDYTYDVHVQDAGPATKKVTVHIPRARIDEVIQTQYKELRTQAVLPGFRPGRAPQKLIERKFATEVKDQAKRTLVSESYQQAVEQNKLQIIGEPEFDDADQVQIPDAGDFSYTFSVEVQPDIALPTLAGLKVKRPKIEIKDENVDQALQNLREQQGALVPVEDRGVEPKDFITGDVHVRDGETVIHHQHDAQLVARPGRIAGVQVEDLDKQLTGAREGEKRTVSVKIPDDHANEQIKGKTLAIEIDVKSIKRVEPAEVNEDFLESLGFASEQELRDALREQMVQRIEFDVKQSMREQVSKYLLDNVTFELPAKLSKTQAERVVQRRAIDLMQRGVPYEQVQQNAEALNTGASAEAQRELKLFFILQKIAADQGVDVDEAELNGRVAMLAAQRGDRPEKMKQQMSKDGSLANLYVTMREQKALDKVLESAEVEEVEVTDEQKKE